MIRMRKFLTALLLLSIGFIFSQNENVEIFDLKNQEPYNLLGINDSLKFPYEVYINLTNVGVRDLTFKSNYFFSRYPNSSST